MKIEELKQELAQDAFQPVFERLYGTKQEVLSTQKARYEKAVARFAEVYPGWEEVSLFSAPGRTEIGGNHTDHQHGCVLAAAVQLDILGVVAFHEDGVIRVCSEGYRPFTVGLSDLSVQEGEKGSAAIVRGIVSRFAALGAKVKKNDYRSIDIGILSAYITAEATALGLSTCIIGWLDSDEIKKICSLEGTPRLVISLGYARKDDPVRIKKRKSNDELFKTVE